MKRSGRSTMLHLYLSHSSHNGIPHRYNVPLASCTAYDCDDDDKIVYAASLERRSYECDTYGYCARKGSSQLCNGFASAEHDLFHCSFFMSVLFVHFPHPFAREFCNTRRIENFEFSLADFWIENNKKDVLRTSLDFLFAAESLAMIRLTKSQSQSTVLPHIRESIYLISTLFAFKRTIFELEKKFIFICNWFFGPESRINNWIGWGNKTKSIFNFLAGENVTVSNNEYECVCVCVWVRVSINCDCFDETHGPMRALMSSWQSHIYIILL